MLPDEKVTGPVLVGKRLLLPLFVCEVLKARGGPKRAPSPAISRQPTLFFSNASSVSIFIMHI